MFLGFFFIVQTISRPAQTAPAGARSGSGGIRIILRLSANSARAAHASHARAHRSRIPWRSWRPLRSAETVSDEIRDELRLCLVRGPPDEGKALGWQCSPKNVREQPEDVDEPPEGREVAHEANCLSVVDYFETPRALGAEPEVLDETGDVELAQNTHLAHWDLEVAQLDDREASRVGDPNPLPPGLQIENSDELCRKLAALSLQIRLELLGEAEVATDVREERPEPAARETLEGERPGPMGPAEGY